MRKSFTGKRYVHIAQKSFLHLISKTMKRDASTNPNFVNTVNWMFQLLLSLAISQHVNPGPNHAQNATNQSWIKITSYILSAAKDQYQNSKGLLPIISSTYNNNRKNRNFTRSHKSTECLLVKDLESNLDNKASMLKLRINEKTWKFTSQGSSTNLDKIQTKDNI